MQLGEYKIPTRMMPLALRSIDLNRDRAEEIILTAYEEDYTQPYSMVLSFKGNPFTEVAERLPYYLNVVRIPPDYMPTLLGQKGDPSRIFSRGGEDELMKQGGRYGVKLKAQAPSIHLIKCNTYTEVAPIVGSESQSQELVMYLLKEFEENPSEIWDTNIFGKSLHELVSEGLNNKLYRMPIDARNKFRETIERVINEGCNGLICIIL